MKRALASILLILSAASLSAQAPRKKSRLSFLDRDTKKGGAATFKYRTLELVKDEYVVLQGDAQIKYQDITVSADKITYMEKTQEIIAEGHVIVDQGPQRLSADRAEYNLEKKTGVLINAKGSFDPSIYFTGKRVEKLDEDTYRLTDAVVTSCDLEDPDWSFHVGSGLVTVEDYARLRNIAMFAERLPVFWMPYLMWPTKRDRARGLLIPRVGSNDIFGEYIENSYFLPLGQSMDLTLRGDFYSEGAVRSGGIFRYTPTPNARGNFEGYFVSDPERSNIEWRYQYQHTQEHFPGGFRAVVDIRDFSNLEFFKSFEREFELRTLSNIYSSAYLSKNRPQDSFNIRMDRREHFLPSLLGIERSVVFEQFPSLQYNVYPQRVGNTPVYFSLESSATQIRRKERQVSSEFLSSEYLRGDLFPTVSMQLRTAPWLSINPQLSLRQTYYTATIDPASRLITDESLSRFYGQGQVEFVGPSFSRIYNRSIRDFARFKHVIEPRVRYVHTTDVEEQGRVIQFDTVDAPFLPLVNDQVEYSLTQRLLAKPKGENTSAREILSISLRQSFAVSEPFRLRGTEEQRFTPLGLNVRFNPYQSVTFDANASFGNISHQLDQLNISANLSSKSRYLNLNWFASFLPPGQTVGGSSQFRVSTGVPIWRDKLRADVHVNYDAEREQFLERRYGATFSSSCFGIALEAREFLELRINEDPRMNRGYQITLDLKNVGPLRGSF